MERIVRTFSVTFSPVAPSPRVDGLDEHAVDVTQRNGEAVEFQFGRVVDRHRRLARVLAECVADALVERDDVFVGETVVQRQHGLIVHDRLKAARRLAAHALSGRIRHDQVRMLAPRCAPAP